MYSPRTPYEPTLFLPIKYWLDQYRWFIIYIFSHVDNPTHGFFRNFWISFVLKNNNSHNLTRSFMHTYVATLASICEFFGELNAVTKSCILLCHWMFLFFNWKHAFFVSSYCAILLCNKSIIASHKERQ